MIRVDNVLSMHRTDEDRCKPRKKSTVAIYSNDGDPIDEEISRPIVCIYE
jgi:hypothetical protein